jgi:hypothetical protein
VRNFRVLLMRDARVTRRPARRTVELTVWDVLSLAFDGASAGQFKEGQAFQVGLAPICSPIFFELRILFLRFLFLGYEFTSDAEECVDGSQCRGRTRVPQHK